MFKSTKKSSCMESKYTPSTLVNHGNEVRTGISRLTRSTSFLSPLATFGHGIMASNSRKRRQLEIENEENDTMSVKSLQVTNTFKEPSSKRVKTLRKSVASFANLISPGKPGRNKLQRSSSFKESTGPTFKPYRPPGSNNNSSSSSSSGVPASSGSANTPGRRGTGSATKSRSSKLWCETFDHSGLDQAELKRQEAIFELYQGDRIMVQDLKMAKQTYRDSMMTLKMLTAEEVTRIFGKLDCLLPLHDDLLARLEQAREADGRINMVGQVFIDWFPTLSPYNEYCANQADAKETLDAVVNREKRVRDFLQRCLESPFSRKLDLWSYLDLPRSRLVKYPLLLKAILKVTPPDHEDTALLHKALKIINGIITRVDYLTGERQSKFVQSKLEYLDDKQKCKDVDNSRKILCSGQLKSSRGTKLHVFLFDLALVLTRNATRGEKLTYQVYRQPLSLKSLVVETEEGGKLSGSFRGGLLSSDKAKHSFRVKSEELNVTYTLIAADEHDKKQWINSLQEAINEFRPSVESPGNQSPIPRRGGSEKSALDKSGAKPAVTVKRSASVKSESGSPSPWHRNRSMTVNGNPVRRNSKGKKDSNDLKKKSKLSPLSIRRSSKPEALSLSKPSDVAEVTTDEKPTESENLCKRSRSLTSSPIAFIANLPKRSPKRDSALARSESCSSKPPSGRVQALTNHYNLRSAVCSQTPPRSPRLPITRSIPDLSKTQNDNQLTLEDVKKQLSPKAAEPKTQPIVLDSTKNSQNLSLNHKTSRFPTVPPLMVNSPDHPAASNTSQDFPIVEEDVLSPLCKSLVSTSSRLSLITSSPTLPDVIALPLSPPSVVTARPNLNPIETIDSSSTSSESLEDVILLMDDVEMILDEAGEEQSDDDHVCSHGIRLVDYVASSDFQNDVLDTLNGVIDLVCQRHGVVPCSDEVELCRDDHVIISTDDDLPCPENDVETTA